MIRIVSQATGRLLLLGDFRTIDGLEAYFVGQLEGSRPVRLPAHGISCPATVHNADVIDAAPCVVSWETPRPAPPVRQAVTYTGPLPLRTTQYKHQAEDFGRQKDLPVFAWLWDMGTGKTKQGVDTAAYLWKSGKIDMVVILAPKGVHTQWIDEQFPAHCGVDYVSHIISLSAWGVRANAALEKSLEDRSVMLALAVNTDAVNSDRGFKLLQRAMARRKVLMIVDESHYIKTPNANRTKNVTSLGRYAKFRRIATGTPISRGAEDLFSQFRFLDPNILGYSTFTAFCAAFCIRNEDRMIVGYRNLDKLRALVAPYSSRVRKSECNDLPPKVYAKRFVELSAEQSRYYKDVKEQLKAYVSGTEERLIEVKNVMEGLLRLRQIVGGFLPDGTALPCPRFEAVSDILVQAPGRVVLWATHTAEILALADLVPNGRPVVTYYGATSDADRSEAIRSWRESSNGVFVSNPAAGGTGLNLDGAETVVYYTHSFNAIHRWQSEDRTHRATTRHTVTYTDLIVPNTIDGVIAGNLRKKGNVAEMTLGQLRDLIRSL